MLRHRIILHRQQELIKLENQLNALDCDDAEHHPHRIRSLDWDHEDAVEEGKTYSPREEIIDRIDLKLKHYGGIRVVFEIKSSANNGKMNFLSGKENQMP